MELVLIKPIHPSYCTTKRLSSPGTPPHTMTGSEPMPWLLILIIVVPIFLLAINYYLVRVWGTSDDRKECGCECLGSSGIAQIVAVLGLLLCECSILLLPFDVVRGWAVARRGGERG